MYDLYHKLESFVRYFDISESEASKSASGQESEDHSYFEYNLNTVEPYENDPEASDDGSSSDDSCENEDKIPREELEKR